MRRVFIAHTKRMSHFSVYETGGDPDKAREISATLESQGIHQIEGLNTVDEILEPRLRFVDTFDEYRMVTPQIWRIVAADGVQWSDPVRIRGDRYM